MRSCLMRVSAEAISPEVRANAIEAVEYLWPFSSSLKLPQKEKAWEETLENNCKELQDIWHLILTNHEISKNSLGFSVNLTVPTCPNMSQHVQRQDMDLSWRTQPWIKTSKETRFDEAIIPVYAEFVAGNWFSPGRSQMISELGRQLGQLDWLQVRQWDLEFLRVLRAGCIDLARESPS